MKKYFSSGIAASAIVLASCLSENSNSINPSSNCESCNLEKPLHHFQSEDEPYLKILEKKGFSRSDIMKAGEGYMVEGDLFFPKEILEKEEALGKTTQRADNNRVNQNTVANIRVLIHPSINGWANEIQQAITNWNVVNSQVRFQIVTTNPQITIASDAWTGLPSGMQNFHSSICGAAGFPTGGQPFPFISINMDNSTLAGSVARRIRTITHEFGHTVGIHHTNQGGGTHLEGTPTADAGSLMNGGQCNTGSLVLSEWDRIAINIMYPDRIDIVSKVKSTGSWRVVTSTGSSFINDTQWLNNWAIGSGYELFLGDVNGDGRQDAIAKEKSTGTWYVATSTGNGFNFGPAWITGFAIGTGYDLFAGDVNRDGRTDIIAKEKTTGNWHVALSTGTSFGPAGQWISGWAIGQGYDLLMADVNGDFRVDLIAKEKTTGSWHVALSTGTSFSSAGQWLSGWAIGQGYQLFAGDANGDGRKDLIAKNKINGDWHVAISNGNQFTSAGTWISGFAIGTGYDLFVGDASGDGRTDIIAKEKYTGTWHVATSNGNSFINNSQWLSGYAIGQNYNLLVGDVNGN